MADFISREAAEQLICETCELPCPRSWLNDCGIIDRLNELTAADVVARDCYDRILAENDTMRKQLAQIGKKPGDSMDDVWPVARAYIDPLATHCRYCGGGYAGTADVQKCKPERGKDLRGGGEDG